MKTTRLSRCFAAALAVTMALVLLFAAGYLAVEADHNCPGDDCPICVQLAVCENALKTVGLAVLGIVLAVFAARLVFILPSFIQKAAYTASLVALKVKLSD